MKKFTLKEVHAMQDRIRKSPTLYEDDVRFHDADDQILYGEECATICFKSRPGAQTATHVDDVVVMAVFADGEFSIEVAIVGSTRNFIECSAAYGRAFQFINRLDLKPRVR